MKRLIIILALLTACKKSPDQPKTEPTTPAPDNTVLVDKLVQFDLTTSPMVFGMTPSWVNVSITIRYGDSTETMKANSTGLSMTRTIKSRYVWVKFGSDSCGVPRKSNITVKSGKVLLSKIGMPEEVQVDLYK